MRVAISIGHGFGLDKDGRYGYDPGAINEETGMAESEAAGLIGNVLQEMLRYSPIEVIRIPRCSLEERIQIINAEHQAKPIDLAVEIHLNSFRDVRVNGTEVWYYPESTTGKLAAEYFLLAFRETLHFRNRGIRESSSLAFLRDTAPTAILTEAAFISYHSVATALDKGSLIPKIAWGHALGIWRFAEEIAGTS